MLIFFNNYLKLLHILLKHFIKKFNYNLPFEKIYFFFLEHFLINYDKLAPNYSFY
jgi:hypothetical protein